MLCIVRAVLASTHAHARLPTVLRYCDKSLIGFINHLGLPTVQSQKAVSACM